MITMIIIICVIIFFWSTCKANNRRHDKKQSQKPIACHNQHPICNYKNISYTDKDPHLIEQREKRHNRVWSVLFIINSIHHCQAQSATKREWKYLDSAIEAVKEYKPQYSDIKIAIRFCQIEYARGYCNHKLSKHDLFLIRNIRQLIATNQLPVNRPRQYS